MLFKQIIYNMASIIIKNNENEWAKANKQILSWSTRFKLQLRLNRRMAE
jgi:hypothetical protein